MRQSFKHNGQTFEVRAETGMDILDKPTINRIVVDSIAGELDTDIAKISPILWARYCTYARFLQLTTVTGKGFVFQDLSKPFEPVSKSIQEGYEAWTKLVEGQVFQRQWEAAIKAANKEVVETDPQAASAGENFESA